MTQIYQLTRDDLRLELSSLFAEMKADAQRQAAESIRNLTLTAEETSKTLNVSLPTLWRWSKSGVLQPVYIGGKKLYKSADVLNILNHGIR